MRKKSAKHTSPNILMKKIRSKLPVAGPSAEKANIRKPARKSAGVFCRIQTTIPAMISGTTVP